MIPTNIIWSTLSPEPESSVFKCEGKFRASAERDTERSGVSPEMRQAEADPRFPVHWWWNTSCNLKAQILMFICNDAEKEILTLESW